LTGVAKVVQVRNVPDRVHAVLTRRAAEAGLSLSDYVLRELELVASRDANSELLHQLALLPRSAVSGADAVRSMRDERDGEIARRVARP
jgi:plasmid stability protein